MFVIKQDTVIDTHTNKSVLFFDLRSGSVSATYCMLTPMPAVIFSETQYVPFGRIADTSTFIKESLRILSSVAESSLMYLIRNNMPIPETVNILYTSPWFESNIVKKTTSNDAGHTMTVDMFSEYKEDTYNQLRTLIKTDSRIIEIQHLVTTLNGYIVNKPIGKQYKKSTTSSYASTINATLYSHIEETIARHFPHRKIAHHTLPITMSRALHHIKPGYTGHLVIIHGEATDVCRFKQGHLMNHESFPHGSHVALKKLSGDSLSKEMYSLIGTKKVLPTKLGVQKNIIHATYQEWATFLNTSIRKDTSTIHSNFLIVSEDSVACTYAKEALIKSNTGATVDILDKGHCIGHGIEVNSLSQDTHTLSLIETFTLI